MIAVGLKSLGSCFVRKEIRKASSGAEKSACPDDEKIILGSKQLEYNDFEEKVCARNKDEKSLICGEISNIHYYLTNGTVFASTCVQSL